MAFGTFDGVHEGHRSFLRQAKVYGDHLTVVITPDHLIEQLKGRTPSNGLYERMEDLHGEGLADVVVPGDNELGAYHVVKKHRPDVITIGYDQKGLHRDLMEHLHDFDWEINMVVLNPHEPEKYHSSLSRKPGNK